MPRHTWLKVTADGTIDLGIGGLELLTINTDHNPRFILSFGRLNIFIESWDRDSSPSNLNYAYIALHFGRLCLDFELQSRVNVVELVNKGERLFRLDRTPYDK